MASNYTPFEQLTNEVGEQLKDVDRKIEELLGKKTNAAANKKALSTLIKERQALFEKNYQIMLKERANLNAQLNVQPGKLSILNQSKSV